MSGVKRKIGWWSGAALVVANMVGTAVFTSLGLQLELVQNTLTVLLMWGLGGAVALAGAFCYAEIGTWYPRSGGEYQYLSRAYHPLVGYLSGWVSLTVGFSTPIALAAMAIGSYMGAYLPGSEKTIAILVVLTLALTHSVSLQQSSRFQNAATAVKVLLMLGLILTGLFSPETGNAIRLDGSWREEVGSAAFPVALIYVFYAYSGWNAAAYVTEEIHKPMINLPRALVGGTLVVAVFFVLMQWAILRQAPLQDLQGEIEVGQIAANYLFGMEGGLLVSVVVSLVLISSISAMTWTGPRVVRAMAEDYPFWHFFARDNRYGLPVRATWLQAGLAVLFILTGSFEQLLIYSGFILQLFTFLTVATIFQVRAKSGGKSHLAYRSPGYPWVPVFFLAANAWVLVYILREQPRESLLGLLNLVAGALSYGLAKWMKK